MYDLKNHDRWISNDRSRKLASPQVIIISNVKSKITVDACCKLFKIRPFLGDIFLLMIDIPYRMHILVQFGEGVLTY